MSDGFVDIQVNGYAGITFHGDPLSEDQIRFVARRLHDGGVRAILPTITTDDLGLMAMRLSTMRALIDQDDSLGRLMPAFHIEGPCLSPREGFRGAHPRQHIRPASRQTLEPLIEAAGGPARVAMVTLAPEHDQDLGTTRWLAEQGIIVCAGHTDAPLDVLQEAEQAGLRFFTHLGNGCASTLDRHDNILWRALSLERIRYSIIPDGHHIPYYVVRQWIRWLGVQRCVFTTDCVEAADAPPDCVLPEWRVLDTSGDTPVTRLKGTPYLAGAALSMKKGYENAIRHIGLSEPEARAMCCEQPAELLRPWLGDEP